MPMEEVALLRDNHVHDHRIVKDIGKIAGKKFIIKHSAFNQL